MVLRWVWGDVWWFWSDVELTVGWFWGGFKACLADILQMCLSYFEVKLQWHYVSLKWCWGDFEACLTHTEHLCLDDVWRLSVFELIVVIRRWFCGLFSKYLVNYFRLFWSELIWFWNYFAFIVGWLWGGFEACLADVLQVCFGDFEMILRFDLANI